MKVFIDTNVLMDLCLENRPEKPFAEKIFSAARASVFQLCITTQSIIDLAYCARKNGMDYESFKSLLQSLRSFVQILSIDDLDLLWALAHHSGDFEDDTQYASAYSGVCDFFITRDKALFDLNSPFCPLTVISPWDFLSALEPGNG